MRCTGCKKNIPVKQIKDKMVSYLKKKPYCSSFCFQRAKIKQNLKVKESELYKQWQTK